MTLLTFCSTDNQCAQRVGVHQIEVHLRSPQQGEFVRVKYGLSDFLVHSTKVDFASYSNAHEPHQNHTKPHHDHARTQVLRTILGAIPGCMHAFCMCGVQSDCSVCSRTTKQFRAVSRSTRSNGEARAQQRATAALVSSRSPDRSSGPILRLGNAHRKSSSHGGAHACGSWYIRLLCPVGLSQSNFLIHSPLSPVLSLPFTSPPPRICVYFFRLLLSTLKFR